MRKDNLKRAVLGLTMASLMLTALAGCVVYDPDPHYYYREGYYYRPYYYRPYYRDYYYHRERWD